MGGATLKIDMNKGFTLVHESNMSKLCVSEQEAKDTVAWYKENEDRYNSPDYRKADDANDANGANNVNKKEYWIVYNKSTNRILKSINYTPVDLTSVIV
jgi:hypothetical protein